MAGQGDDDGRMEGAVSATLAGMMDRLTNRGSDITLTDADRLDGRTALVTGASRGLGHAVAVDLARRGAHVILANRSRLAESVAEVKKASGSDEVEALYVDLSDFASIAELTGTLAARGEIVHVVVLNAGVVPIRSRTTDAGLDVMFHVNYLANVALVERLLAQGTVPNSLIADGTPSDPPARLIFVGSESHRDAPPIDFVTFGQPRTYSTREVVAEYGRSKLLLHTYAEELARRLERPEGILDVAVHHVCPGAVNTGIAREAPAWTKPLLKPVMALFFQSARRAAEPVVWLACSAEIEADTGLYLHLRKKKEASIAARDPSAGERLWEQSVALIRTLDPTFVQAVKPDSTPAPAPPRRPS